MPDKKSLSSKLLSWYRANARDLPWRRTRDPYSIWVSEIMLQQTTVKAVIPYYERWLKRFPTVKSLAEAPLEDVLKTWQGLGYYARARNLHRAAGVVLKDHAGHLPSEPEELARLPGFGPYTVGAVASIAFGKSTTIIDANVRRVFMRLMLLKGRADTRYDKEITLRLEKEMPSRNTGDFNQALMELGALICRSKEPTCNVCPLSSLCRAFAQGVQEIIPEPKKVHVKEVEAVIAIVRHQGKYLIQQRPEKGLLAGLWEFPGGKVAAEDASREEALRREIKEELAVDVKSAKHLGQVTHYYTEFRVTLHVFAVIFKKHTLRAANTRWVSAKELLKYPMPSGSAKVIRNILRIA